MPDDHDPELVVTLVHGTWGRGMFPLWPAKDPFWFDEGSWFRTNLEGNLRSIGCEIHIETLKWSGANSIHARNHAAVELAKHLRRIEAECPRAKHLIVAHSHGGNIVRRALEPPEQDTVSHSDVVACLDEVAIVTMGTPFLQVRPAFEDEKFREAVVDSIRNSATTVSMGLLFFIFPSWWTYSLVAFAWSIFTFWAVMGWLLNFDRAAPLVHVTRNGMWWNIGQPVLVVRAVDDEAALALAAATLANKLSFLALRFSLFFERRIMGPRVFVLASLLTFCAYLLYQFAGVASLGPLFSWLDEYGWYIFLVYAVPMILTFTTLFIAAACKSVYGRELWSTVLLCELNCQSVPDGCTSAIVRTLPISEEAAATLRHSIYEHEKCMEYITEFAKFILTRDTLRRPGYD